MNTKNTQAPNRRIDEVNEPLKKQPYAMIAYLRPGQKDEYLKCKDADDVLDAIKAMTTVKWPEEFMIVIKFKKEENI